MEQDAKFLRPVFFVVSITARVTIAELLEKGRARLTTVVTNQDGVVVVDGTALVKLPKED